MNCIRCNEPDAFDWQYEAKLVDAPICGKCKTAFGEKVMEKIAGEISGHEEDK